MAQLHQPLNKIQLELLKLFADDLPEADLIEIKRMLATYRLRKATAAADQQWDEQQWTEADMQRLLHGHERTPYKSLRNSSSDS